MTDLGLIEKDTTRADKTIRRAMDAFETTIDVLNEAVNKLKAEYRAGEKAVMADLKAMNTAFSFAMAMEARARDAAGPHTQAKAAGTLDLDAAREEIGLRLACLRSAEDN